MFSKNISNSFDLVKDSEFQIDSLTELSDRLWYFQLFQVKPVLDITLMDGSKAYNGHEKKKGAMRKSNHDILPTFLSHLLPHKRMKCQGDLHQEIYNCPFIQYSSRLQLSISSGTLQENLMKQSLKVKDREQEN